MKRAPGSGGIRKLSGNRRKKFQAVVTAGKTWVDGEVKVRQKSLGVYATRAEAQAALEEYNKYHFNLDLRSIKFGEVYEYIKEDYTDSMARSMKAATKYCEPIWHKRLIDIRKMDLDMVAELALDKSKSTQSNIKMLVSSVYTWAMENDVVVKDYSPLLRFKSAVTYDKKKSYTKEEITVLRANPEPIQLILLYSGMRIDELLSMKAADVYEEEGILCFHVNKSKTAAGIRIIPVHSEIEPMVRGMLNGNYLIEPHRTYDGVRKQYMKYNREHGINHTFHELRHTFSTFGKSCHMDDFYRKALMGHAQKGLTDSIYTDTMVADLKSQIELLCYA